MTDTLNTITDIDDFEVARTAECNISDLGKHVHVNKTDLTIIAQNIRSIHCNFDDFILNLSDFKFETDVIILTECRLCPKKPVPQLHNYLAYYTTRQLNQNDGVTVYVRQSLKPKVQEIEISLASCLQVEILNHVILGIYRSPANSNIDRFVNSLSAHLDKLKSSSNIIIAGDININIRTKDSESSHEHKTRNQYQNMLSMHGILAGHTLPTRESNCLDHFMLKINKKNVFPFIAVLQTSITDHFTIFLCLSKIKNSSPSIKTKTDINFEQALKHLQQQNLAELLTCDDPNQLTCQFINILANTIENNTIIHKVPNSKQIKKPWITSGILRCIRNRNKLQKQSKANPQNEILKITYSRYRNYCNSLIKKIKYKYERDLLEKSVGNNKLLWKNIKNLTYSNKIKDHNCELLNIKTSPLESVNFVNNHFANVGKRLAQQILPTTHNNRTINQPVQSNTFVLFDTDPHEVDQILMGLKSDSAPGWDKVPTKFLKLARNYIVPIITHLANLCFRKGIFPDFLKQSIIIPIHKGGDRDDVNNYRPISILPSISKIIEKLLNVRLTRYLHKFNLLSNQQFGFRQKISTEDAVSALTSVITERLDAGNKCLAVFLDLKKHLTPSLSQTL